MTRDLNKQEIATILAALRYWQQDLNANEEPPISPHFEDAEPLTSDEIDQLAMNINAHRLTFTHAPESVPDGGAGESSIYKPRFYSMFREEGIFAICEVDEANNMAEVFAQGGRNERINAELIASALNAYNHVHPKVFNEARGLVKNDGTERQYNEMQDFAASCVGKAKLFAAPSDDVNKRRIEAEINDMEPQVRQAPNNPNYVYEADPHFVKLARHVLGMTRGKPGSSASRPQAYKRVMLTAESADWLRARIAMLKLDMLIEKKRLLIEQRDGKANHNTLLAAIEDDLVQINALTDALS